MASGNSSMNGHGYRQSAPYQPYDRGAPPHYTMESPSPARYDPWEIFEERLRTNLPHRVAMHPFHPFRVLMDEDDFWRYGRAMTPALQNFVRASPLRFTNRVAAADDDGNGSGSGSGGRHLTPAEIDTVLKKLKTEVYKPASRKSGKTGNKLEKAEENDPNKHTCSICLEDFFAKQQILRLPCKHRFHSECLTPWIKSHGQCPVCRLDLTGRRSEGGAPSHRNNEENGTGQVIVVNATAQDEMALLIRAMEEAFAWLNPSHR